MSEYRVRVTKPRESRWFTVRGESVEDAIQDWHLEHGLGYSESFRVLTNGCREDVYFLVIETDAGVKMTSRVYCSGLYRSGGVKPRYEKTIADVAAKIGWTKDPAELLDPWDGEETWEDVRIARSPRQEGDR